MSPKHTTMGYDGFSPDCPCCSSRRKFIQLTAFSALARMAAKSVIALSGTEGKSAPLLDQKGSFPYFQTTPVSYLREDDPTESVRELLARCSDRRSLIYSKLGFGGLAS